jgi:hypothetical protein
MDILSKDTLALIENESIQKAFEQLLKSTGETTSVRVPLAASNSDASDDPESESKQVVTVRRLSV